MPLCHLGPRAVLMLSRTRRPAVCKHCGQPIAAQAPAWRPLVEDIKRGLHRGVRYHAEHFRGGQAYSL